MADFAAVSARYGAAALASVLLEPHRVYQLEGLSPDVFASDTHRKIYKAIKVLHEHGCQPDLAAVVAELGDKVDAGYVASLIDGVMPESLPTYVRRLKETVTERNLARTAEELQGETSNERRLVLIDKYKGLLQPNVSTEFSLKDNIADIFSLKIQPPTELIPDLIEENTVIVAYGEAKTSKSTIFALGAGIAIASGGEFLGRQCQRRTVLLVDFENPAQTVLERLEKFAGGPVPGLFIWGMWQKLQPPRLGDPRLLAVARAEHPLIVIDPLIASHQVDENESSEMRPVLMHARQLAAAGATVILIHHATKNGETYRGTTDIIASADTVFSVERDGEDTPDVCYRKLCIRWARSIPQRNFGVKIDWNNGKFESTDTTLVLEHKDHIELLRSIIDAEPLGITQNKIIEQSGLRRADVIRILRQKDGVLWGSANGPRRAKLYRPLSNDSTGSHDWFPEDAREPVRELVPTDSLSGSHTDSHYSEPVNPTPVVPGFPVSIDRKPELVGRVNGRNEVL
jgi:hypothetical protein